MSSKEISKTVSEYTAEYSQYVAQNRAIGSLMDGLKPVQRRCLLSAYDLKLFHNKKFMKVAKLSGQVMGDYHPHGGASMVSLAQPFSSRYLLFEGQGNFGSPDLPGSVAAERYIECRLTKFAEDFYLSSIEHSDKDDNYDGRLKETTLFYPVLPGCLITGAQGIAVGLSTCIPVHNIHDIGTSLLHFIDNPESEDFLNYIIPDTCEGSIILTPKDEIKDMYREGSGSIAYKAKTHYETIDGKSALVVDAFPPGYSKKRLETSVIIEAVESGELELVNESKESIRYVFLSNNLSILETIEERLTNSVGYRFYIEHRGVIKKYPLSDIYTTFVKEKSNFIVRKYTDLDSKLTSDLDYYNILLLFKKNRDYIKSMFDKDSNTVINDIVSMYNTSEDIAKRIIGTSIRSLLKDNESEILDKINKMSEQSKVYKSYIEDPIMKIKLDIEDLLSNMKDDSRRAIHIDDKLDEQVVQYRGNDFTIHMNDFYYCGTSDNKLSTMRGSDLVPIINDSMCVESVGYDYYVLYDNKGLCSVISDKMNDISKLKSDKLLGILGTNNLSDIIVIKGNGKPQELDDWSLRSRRSYIKMSSENEPDIRVNKK